MQFEVQILEQLEDVKINELGKIPEKCGIYIISFNTGEKRVGSSTKLRTRLCQHLCNNQKNIVANIREKFESVTVYITENHINALILEQVFIRDLSSYNYPLIKRKSGANINKMFQKAITSITLYSKQYLDMIYDQMTIVEYIRGLKVDKEPKDDYYAVAYVLEKMEEIEMVDMEMRERIYNGLIIRMKDNSYFLTER